MDRFAFLAHPTGLNNLYFILGRWSVLLNRLPKRLVKIILKHLPPFKFLYTKEIRSCLGNKVDGITILCPLLPEQMVELDSDLILKKIIYACRLAQRSGAKIVGLGGFTSIFSNQGEDVVKKLKIAVTTGNTYTASLVVEGVTRAAELMQYDLKNMTIAIIGATGDIGRSCTVAFYNKARKLLLVAREQGKLLDFVSSFGQHSNRAEIEIIKYSNEAASRANVIITATSAITTLLEAKDLKSGAIVCDVSLPPNIARDIVKQRDDVLVFEGGYAKLPFFEEISDSGLRKYFPFGAVFGCLAETIVLALEGKFENFSIGRGHITLEKMNEMRAMGEKHGFGLSSFFCGEKIFKKDDINKIIEKAKVNE